MTDEELFKVYIKREVCAHCRFPQFCKGKGEKDCSDIAIIKRHYLAGVEAGKSQAETDLAIVAYMQGAERYKPEWHYVKDGDLPEENQWVLVYDGSYTVCNYHSNTPIKWLDNYENEVYEGSIIAWKEITPPKEIEENEN